MKNNPVLVFIECIGIITLCLVIFALIHAPWVYIIDRTSPAGLVVQLLMVAMIGISIVRSLLKVLGKRIQSALGYGIILLMIGGIIFFIFPSFFTTAYTAPRPHYWVLVSYYSLPAIMIEGGLFTIFDALISRAGVFISKRERTLALLLITLYLIFAVSANFLAIAGVISILHQIWFSRSVVVITGLILFVLWNRKK